MTGIVVLDKSTLVTLQNSENKHIRLNQPSIIRLGYTKEQIASVEHMGDKAIIILKNGEKIILDNFVHQGNETPHQILLSNTQGIFEELVITAQGYQINYDPKRVIQELEASQTYLAPENMKTSQVAEETVAWYEKDLVKPALILLGLEGIYLAAFHDNDDDGHAANTDLVAPSVPTATLDSDGKVVTGKAEAGAIVYVKDVSGKTLGQAVADAEGNFKLTLDRDVINNEKVLIYAKDAAGNESQVTVITGTKDTIAPDAAQVQINETGSIVSGQAEAGAKVYVYDAVGKTVLAGPVTVASDGTFSISIIPALATGAEAKVVVKDAAGNESDASTVIVGKDTLAPKQPSIEVNAQGDQVTGYAEANSKITIKNSQGEVIAFATADDQGYFTAQIKPALAKDETANLTVTDAAGNASKDLVIKAGMDTIASDAVTAKLNAEGNEVTGQTGANQKVEIYNKEGTLIGSTVSDAAGKFSITLKSSLTDQAIAHIYTFDAAGNKSESTQVIGTKDTIAPNKVVLKTVTDDVNGDGDQGKTIANHGETDDARPEFAGTGESGAIVTIYDNGQAIATVKVESGKWTFTPSHDLALGEHSFTFTQMDAANNSSVMSEAFGFTVIAAEATAKIASEAYVDEHAIAAVLNNVAVLDIAPENQYSENAAVNISSLMQQESVSENQDIESILQDVQAAKMDVNTVQGAISNPKSDVLAHIRFNALSDELFIPVLGLG
ncbi:Ig-like domain-containing protein [Acinetobacter piscicola]|uniref:Ig-like domain-containing protein n=1 Tax=Acinetobacter piscicola TaxID=2006115 RepID=UPI003556AF13